MKDTMDFDIDVKTKKKVLTQEQIELKEIERREKTENELKLQEQELRPWIQELFECYNNQEKLYQLFLVWSDTKGFKNEQWFDTISKILQGGNWKIFINIVKNQWLNSFSDCNKKQRGIKIKRIEYQFEKQPRKLYTQKFENEKLITKITDYGEEQLRIQEQIDKFVLRMNS